MVSCHILVALVICWSKVSEGSQVLIRTRTSTSRSLVAQVAALRFGDISQRIDASGFHITYRKGFVIPCQDER